MRKLYLYSLLRQDIGWYDVNRTGDFASILTESLWKIQEALGEKVAIYVFFKSVFVSGAVTSLLLGWELALISFVCFPATMIFLGIISWVKILLLFFFYLIFITLFVFNKYIFFWGSFNLSQNLISVAEILLLLLRDLEHFL